MTGNIRLTRVGGWLAADLACRLAEVTRAAFAVADPVPGLPIADGARECAAVIHADLASGALLWLARDDDGEVRGSVRAVRRPGTDCWEVRRLAVDPRWRGSGLARALMRRLESDAHDAGVPLVRLDAVVERGNPSYYAALGYRTVRHFPSPDKQLSEVAMARDPGLAPAPAPYPWPDRAPVAHSVSWFTVAGRTVAVAGRGGSAVGARTRGHARMIADRFGAVPVLIGTDGWFGGIGEPVPALRVYQAPPAQVPAFTMPRTTDRRLLALHRLPMRRTG